MGREMQWFGENWLAPVCTMAEHVAAPVGKRCARCDLVINILDTGFLLPYFGEEGAPAYIALHRQCFINAVLRAELPDEPVVNKQPGFDMKLDSPVIAYCAEECWRQGHRGEDNFVRTMWMMKAWDYAVIAYADLQERHRTDPCVITLDDILVLGKCIEPSKNARGLRKVGVTVGGHPRPHHGTVKALLDDMLSHQARFTPLEFYREFELIHPFVDGNGRTGKVLLNWRNRTLGAPIFPPHDFWGRSILNP